MVAIGCTVAYSAAAIIRHHRLNSRTLDLALQHQVVWNTAHGRWFESSIEVANYLGDHVSFNALPVAALYRLWPSVETLLVLQAAALTAAGVLCYFVARRVTNDAAAAFLAGLAFLLHPACALQSLNDFHLTVLGLPWVFAGILCALDRRWWLASLLLVPALFAKEDVGLTLALFGVYAAIKWRARLFGALWAFVGVAWPLAAVLLIIPTFRGGRPSDTWLRYSWLLSPDIETARHVAICALHGALMLAVPLALVPFRSAALAIGLVTYGYCFSSRAALWMANPAFQSLVPVVPFVFLALAQGVSKLSTVRVGYGRFAVGCCCVGLAANEWAMQRMGVPNSSWLYVQTGVLCAAGIGAMLAGRRVSARRGWFAMAAACFVAYNPFTYVLYPAEGSIFRRHSPASLADVRAADELIPPDASLAASPRLAPHFSARRMLYQLPSAPQCQYVVFCPRDDREEDPRLVGLFGEGLLADLGFVKCFEQNTLQVWRKTSHFATPDVPAYETISLAGQDTDLGADLARRGQLEKAITYYQALLKISAENKEALLRLGGLLRRTGRDDEAVKLYESAVLAWPDFAEAHNNLANALRAAGRVEEAIAHYEEALRLQPAVARVHSNLGAAYAQQGRTAEAIAAVRRAIRLDPDMVTAHANLAGLLVRERRFGEAIEALRQGLSRRPDHLAMANQLAWLLATSPDAGDRDGRQAVAIAEQLCQATGYGNAEALNTLAAAYAEAGRFDDAVDTATQARRIAIAEGNDKLAARVASLLALYRAGRAYHQSP